MRPIVLAVVAAGLVVAAVELYSTPGELSSPSFATIQLKSTFPIAAILYDVSQKQLAPSITKVTVYVQLPSNVLHPPLKTPAAELWLEVPPGIAFKNCPRDNCRLDANEKEYTWFEKLDFKYKDPDNNSGEAFVTYFVRDHSFGYSVDDINAAAAIPRMVYLGPAAVTPILYTEYSNVAGANSYDWSTLQPQLASASEILWDEPVTSGAAPGTVAVGINSANEAKDNWQTFIAGALLGVAGGALVAFILEVLPASDPPAERQKGRADDRDRGSV